MTCFLDVVLGHNDDSSDVSNFFNCVGNFSLHQRSDVSTFSNSVGKLFLV